MAEAVAPDLGGFPGSLGAGARVTDVLVVGAGLAGAHLCQRLRAEGFAGRIVVVGAEPDLPYDRPPLTSSPGLDTDLARTMGIDVTELADEVLLGTTALGVPPNASALATPPGTSAPGTAVGPTGSGAAEAGRAAAGAGQAWSVQLASASPSAPDRVRAEVVVAATGASPVRPAGWDSAALLHTRRQADELWARVRQGARLVVAGGGWIGCEVARTAADRGARAVLIEGGEQLLPGRVPAAAAAHVRALIEQVGVTVRLGQMVDLVSPGGPGVEVRLGNEVVEADVVLAALGVRPETAWLSPAARRAGSGAIVTDPWGRTSLPGVFALGDAAARWSGRAGTHVPGGHWTAAFEGARTVAPAIREWLSGSGWTDPLGTPADDLVPYTFSDLGPHRLVVLGDAAAGTEVWREQGTGWTVYLLDDQGRLTGLVALDRPRDMVAARKAIRATADGRPEVDPEALADPAAPPARCFPGLAAPQAPGSR